MIDGARFSFIKSLICVVLLFCGLNADAQTGDFLSHCGEFLERSTPRTWIELERRRGSSTPGASVQKYVGLSTWKRFETIFENPLYQKVWKVGGSSVIGDLSSRKTSIKTFPAEFRFVPMEYFGQNAARAGIGEEAQLFALYLPEHPENVARSVHLPNAFAYIRFYLLRDKILVTEIQSDSYGELPKEKKETYRDWSALIVTAFENAVRTQIDQFTKEAKGAKEGRSIEVLIADPDYQHRRWIRYERGEQVDGISSELTRIIYRDLPKRLGYQFTDVSSYDFAPEWPEHLSSVVGLEVDEDALSPTRISKAWSKTIDPNHVSALATDFQKSAEVLSEPGLSDFRQALLSGQVPYLRSAARGAYVRSDAETVALNDQQSERLLRLPFQFEPTLWSLGISSPSQSDVVTDFEGLLSSRIMSEPLFVHLIHHERHPFFIFRDVNGSTRTLSYKGAGRLGKVNAQDQYAVSSDVLFPWLPVLGPDQDDQILATWTHRAWGGLTLRNAQQEWKNNQGLQSLYNDYLNDGAPIAQAVALTIPQQIPVVMSQEGDIEYWNQRDYLERYVPNVKEPLAQLVYLSKSQVRVSDVVQVFERSDPHLLQKAVASIYEAHGEKFDPIKIGRGKQIKDWKESMLFLEQIYRKNRKTAEKILDTIERKSLSLMGLVHGAGGHLGGEATNWFTDELGRAFMSTTPFGSVNGGSPAIRNFTIAGEYTDTDDGLYLPWLGSSPFDEIVKMHGDNLTTMQLKDLRYWQQSIYWLRALLKGRSRPQKVYMDDPFAFGSFFLVVPDGFDWEREIKEHSILDKDFRIGKGPLENSFREERLKGYYATAVRAGERTREISGP